MKRKLFVILFCFNLFSLFSYDGIMTGEKNLKVLQTKWFDIVFPESSEKSAIILYQNADSIYQELAEIYGFPLQFRMPVVLTSKVEQMNAYWSAVPYNHIVIYDTALIDDLAVFSENLLSTFRHELTHAYTYNLKNKFWRGVGFFADLINPAYLFITSGWAEGATLTSESAGGEGRLNNEFAMQMVKQAKLENKFPKYADVQGASDKYPVGSFYYFSGAFNQWLQEKYGMEKYAAFWYKCVNFQTISTRLAFKKIYGIRINTAWEEFRKSFEVPDIPANPIETKLVKDFFEHQNQNYSINNNSSSVFSSLKISEKGFAYLDLKANAVYFVPKENFADKKIKPQKLFSLAGIQSIDFSFDGRFIIAEFLDYSDVSVKKGLALYDLQNKKFDFLKTKSVFYPSIVKNNHGYFLVGVKYADQQYSLYFEKIRNLDGKSCSEESYDVDLDFQDSANYFTDLQNGTFAYVKKSKLNYSICVSDLSGKVLKEFSLPQSEENQIGPNFDIRYLSFDAADNSLIFSWCKKGTMPRFGSLNLETETFNLQKSDFSGGVYYPVAVDSGTIIYSGEFYRQNRIFFADKDLILEDSEKINQKTLSKSETEYEIKTENAAENQQNLNNSENYNDILASAKNYNPFKFMKRGIFLPISTMESLSFSDESSASYLLPLGITYITSNPWLNNTIMATIGYGYETNSWGFDIAYSTQSSSSLLSFSSELATEFDTKGWKQSRLYLTGGINLPFGKVSSINFSDTVNVFVGRGNTINYDINKSFFSIPAPGYAASTDLRNFLYVANQFGISYSNIHKTGAGKYEKAGFAIGSVFVLGYLKDISQSLSQGSLGNVELNLKFAIPKLIPIKCVDCFTYNLPTTILFSGLPYILYTYDTTQKRPNERPSLFTTKAESILFAYDLQKAIPFLPGIFIANFDLSFVYYGGLNFDYDTSMETWLFTKLPELFEKASNGKFNYSHAFALKASVKMGPNFGTLAQSSIRIDLFGEFGLIQNFTSSQNEVKPYYTFGVNIN